MNEKSKSMWAIGSILVGLVLAIAMFVIFLNQKNHIEELKEEALSLNEKFKEKKLEYERLYIECLETKAAMDSINQAEVDEARRIAQNADFHLGISAPTLTNAEGLTLLSKLKTEGYTIWYANQNNGDLGNMYYYGNGQEKAEELKSLIHELFPNRSRIDLTINEGGAGSGIPQQIRDNAIIIKI